MKIWKNREKSYLKFGGIMENSKVFFMDLRTKPGMNLLQKLEIMLNKAGIETIDFKNRFTAIKIHFGEPGNLAYIQCH